LNESVLNSSK